jgi:hypothetical protein
MTAKGVAELLSARRTSSGKWQARCPAHPDRSPSLSIREGAEGRVLVHCFAGCRLESVLEAAGLRVTDLFPEGRNSQTSLQAMADRTAERIAGSMQQQRSRAAAATVCTLNEICDALAARIAHMPDDATEADVLTRLYHGTLDKLRAAQVDCEL